MATGKRYYWMKLKEDFMTSDTVDYFMSLPNGANYVVLYQLLCLKTINTGGRLSRQIGEIIIPYDVAKIQRDTKWFTTDTVRVAMELYKKFGLIYEDMDGVLVLADHNNLVGSETNWAQQKRNQKLNSGEKQPLDSGNKVESQVENFHPEIRGKESRYKDTDIREVEVAAEAAPPTSSIPCPFEEIQKLWNDICVSLPHVDNIQCERRKLVQERWNEYPSLDKFEEVFRKVEASRFLKGDNKKNWIIQFNWLMKSDHFTKTLEGNYDYYKAPRDPNSSFDLDDLMDEIRKQYQD